MHFPGTDVINRSMIDPDRTCVLMISQSGQTFPTLHAIRKLCRLAGDKIWIMTGCINSKMELSLMEYYQEEGIRYRGNRVINNLSGRTLTEPASLTVAATWHTLTHLLIRIAKTFRYKDPLCRIRHPWEAIIESAAIINKILKSYIQYRKARKGQIGMHVGAAVDFTSTDFQYYRREQPIEMYLSDGCIEDFDQLVAENLVRNVSMIVGTDESGIPISTYRTFGMRESNRSAGMPHDRLVDAGIKWGKHVSEYWTVMVCASAYIVVAVALGIPVFSCIGTSV